MIFGTVTYTNHATKTKHEHMHLRVFITAMDVLQYKTTHSLKVVKDAFQTFNFCMPKPILFFCERLTHNLSNETSTSTSLWSMHIFKSVYTECVCVCVCIYKEICSTWNEMADVFIFLLWWMKWLKLYLPHYPHLSDAEKFKSNSKRINYIKKIKLSYSKIP